MFRTTILWLWMGALLTSTVGISVTRIYCYCVGKTTYSVFVEPADACAAEPEPTAGACCKSDAPACCAVESAEGTHTCTKKTVQVFQMKADFLVGNPLDKTFDFPFWAGELPVYRKLYHPGLCRAVPSNKAPPKPPPPLSGRTICLRHELFRC
ncbi:MAG: hypothetical protein IPM98_19605 [Lewinellaceae bacterium]|nr:hypothetical protein [Lewinellaceae bacterium]